MIEKEGVFEIASTRGNRPSPAIPQAFPTPKPLVIQYGLDISSIYAAGLARALAHSRALRFARVKVAEIQLYQASQVKSGRAARDLYGALAPILTRLGEPSEIASCYPWVGFPITSTRSW